MTDHHTSDDAGHLDDNVIYFIRVLRASGLPVGPDRVVDALQAIRVVGIESRQDFYWALRSVLLDRHDQIETFDQAFYIFWRDPAILERAKSLPLPDAKPDVPKRPPPPAAQRVLDALRRNKPQPPLPPTDADRLETTARLQYSEAEVLQYKDFEAMSGDELAQARRALAHMKLALKPVSTRRRRPSAKGDRIDMRATLRASQRGGAGPINLQRSQVRTRQPGLVVLCDISGSMAVYSRLLLHFVHGLCAQNQRVATFLFGTRLSNITHYLVDRDVDAALKKIGHAVEDWSGGTRIGACLHEFNHRWSRRVLSAGTVVLLISDGLDRDAGAELAPEMERLSKSCRRVIWLNPLLRYEGFEARPAGIQAMLPWVDDFLPVHNLDSMEKLTHRLSGLSGFGTR